MALDIISKINLDLKAPNAEIVYGNQYDSAGRILAQLLNGGEKWVVPTGAIGVVSYMKTDRIGGYYDTTTNNEIAVSINSSDRSLVSIALDEQTMTTMGIVNVQINFYQNNKRLSTFCFKFQVNKSPITSSNVESKWFGHLLVLSGIVVDNTLSISGAAADSAQVGNAITTINTNIAAGFDRVDNVITAINANIAAEINRAQYAESLKVNKPASNPNGTSGQLLRTNGDGTTMWVDEGLPTDQQTAEAVSNWLDEHPEATTTVEDNSLAYEKFMPSAVDRILDQASPLGSSYYYFIDCVNGDDNNDGLTINTPFRTLDKVADVHHKDDLRVQFISPGTYDTSIQCFSTMSIHFLNTSRTSQGTPGEVILHFSAGHAVQFYNCYTHFEGISFSWDTNYDFYFDSGFSYHINGVKYLSGPITYTGGFVFGEDITYVRVNVREAVAKFHNIKITDTESGGNCLYSRDSYLIIYGTFEYAVGPDCTYSVIYCNRGELKFNSTIAADAPKSGKQYGIYASGTAVFSNETRINRIAAISNDGNNFVNNQPAVVFTNNAPIYIPNNASGIKPGDILKIDFYGAGYIASGKTKIIFSIVLPKPLFNSVSGAEIYSISDFELRAVEGGKIFDGVDVIADQIIPVVDSNTLYMSIQKSDSSAFDAANNDAPIGIKFIGRVLFS